GSARANSLTSTVDGSSSTTDIKTKERTLTFGISLVSEGYIGDTTYFNGNELVGTDLSVTSRTDVTITSPVEFSITDGKLAMSYKKTNYEFALGGTDSIKLTAEGLVVDNSAQSWNVDADVKVTELKSSNYIQYPKKIGEAIAGYIGPSEKDYINSVYDGLYDMIKSGKIEIVTKENPLADVTLKVSGVAKKETTENDFEYVVIGSPNYANGPALAAGNDQTADPTNLILSLIEHMNTNAIVDFIKSIDTEKLAESIRTIDFLPILDDFSIPTVDVSDLSSIDVESVYKALADKISKMDWDAVAEAIKEKDFRPVTHALQDRIANLTDEEKQAILSFFHTNGDDMSGSDRVYVLGQKNEDQVFVMTDYLSVSLLNKESYAQVSDWTVDYVVDYYENSPLTQIGTVVYGDLSDSQANQIQKNIDKVADSSSSSGSDGKLFDYIWLIVIIVALIGGAAAANYYHKNKKN
ncbi:MAG: hypothetical protein IJ856_00370, partial [Candidatus Methanomethylophilaceae archaeon]|nr:hypothetical protein [Candidatus Methanomethylophilaceae archaeon]